MRRCPTLVFLLPLTQLLSLTVGDPRCSKVALHAWCSANTTHGLVHALSSCNYDHVAPMIERRCRLNEKGDYCGSFADYIPDIQAARRECLAQEEPGECSESCSSKLELLREELGCCINEMANSTGFRTGFLYAPVFDHALWEYCNVTTAAPSCRPSPLTRALTTEKENCTLDELYDRANQASCKRNLLQPLLEWYESHGCGRIGEDQINTCGIDEHGQWCIERINNNRLTFAKIAQSAITHCPRTDECSRDCRTSLQALREVMGCCLNNILNNTFAELVYAETYEYYKNYTSYALWKSCGVPHPGYCNVTLYGVNSSRFAGLSPFYAVVVMFVVIFTTQPFYYRSNTF